MVSIIVYILIVLLCFYAIYQILGDVSLFPNSRIWRLIAMPFIIFMNNILTFSVISVYYLISSMNQ